MTTGPTPIPTTSIKYHINIPIDVNSVPIKTLIQTVYAALADANVISVSAWVATLGHSGWRISVVFGTPFPSSAEWIKQRMIDETYKLAWELFGDITVWLHP